MKTGILAEKQVQQHDETGNGRDHGTGLAGFTQIATPQGWQALNSLRPGDPVLTAEHGPRRIAELRATPNPLPNLPPVLVPPCALNNRTALLLSADHLLLIETDLAEIHYGDPLALLPAAALIGWRGIAAAGNACSFLSLQFDAPQIIYASRAMLLPCDAVDGSAITDPPPYPMAQARHLVACLMAEDLGGALRAARKPYAAV